VKATNHILLCVNQYYPCESTKWIPNQCWYVGSYYTIQCRNCTF